MTTSVVQFLEILEGQLLLQMFETLDRTSLSKFRLSCDGADSKGTALSSHSEALLVSWKA